jgi:predicted enzyme related to lactoylglutathione lyase
MIGGMHTILYSKNAEAVRAFFRDVLQFPSVDAGHGWLIFATPPAEIAVHPTEDRSFAELYLMCDDLESTVESLKSSGVEFPTPVTEQRWGLLTHLKLPDGELLGLYEPRHALSIQMKPLHSFAGRKSPARKARVTKKRTRRARTPKRKR